MLKSLCLGASLLTLAAVLPAEAKTRALLVGVADYDKENGIRDLLGPRNDVSIIWRGLKARGADPADITVLTDGLPTAPEYPVMNGAPKYQEIVAAFDRIANEVESGDTFVFYYSGHGSTQPDADPAAEAEPEPDGNDQILLPADVGAYDPIKKSIKNALVDDELALKFKAIRDKGAFVWVVVDACHSGTVTRGDDVTRSVDPQSLGVPERVTRGAPRAGNRGGALTAADTQGGIVGFYAVDAQDEAIERPFTGYNLPMTGEGKKQRMGVFTYHLHRMLTQGGAFTYRDLAQQMVADLQTDKSGGRVPPPVFDGDLDKPILGGAPGAAPVVLGSLKDKVLEIPAGTLQGFEAGALISVLDPKHPEIIIGRAAIADASAISSTATDIDWDDGVTPPLAGALPVVVAEPAVSFTFTIAPPSADELKDETAEKAIALAFGPDSGSADLGIALGEAKNPDADVMIYAANGRLWIGRPERPLVMEPGRFDETPSLPIGTDPEKLAADLKDTVWTLAKAARLIRVTSAASAPGGGSADIEISAQLYRNPETAGDPKKACELKANRKLPKQDIAPMMPVAAANCDFIEIKVLNNSETTYYIGGFYVDARGKIDAMIPEDKSRGCARTLYPGGEKPVTYKLMIQTWDADKNAPAATGIENSVILAIPQDSTKIAPRLCSLIQPSISALQATRSAEGTRAGAKKGLTKLLEGIGGGATRSAGLAIEDEEEEGAPKMAGRLFVFDVRP